MADRNCNLKEHTFSVLQLQRGYYKVCRWQLNIFIKNLTSTNCSSVCICALWAESWYTKDRKLKQNFKNWHKKWKKYFWLLCTIYQEATDIADCLNHCMVGLKEYPMSVCWMMRQVCHEVFRVHTYTHTHTHPHITTANVQHINRPASMAISHALKSAKTCQTTSTSAIHL